MGLRPIRSAMGPSTNEPTAIAMSSSDSTQAQRRALDSHCVAIPGAAKLIDSTSTIDRDEQHAHDDDQDPLRDNGRLASIPVLRYGVTRPALLRARLAGLPLLEVVADGDAVRPGRLVGHVARAVAYGRAVRRPRWSGCWPTV
jgi:hypothetical protein